MDWEQIQRIQREVVIPELEEWAAGVPLLPYQGMVDQSPLWILDAVVIAVSHRNVLGPMGALFRSANWNAPTYSVMSIVLSAKHGIIDGSAERARLIAGLESRLRPFGPLDNLRGDGPGKPTVVVRDRLNRLHNADGPAVRFHDRALHALSGVYIPTFEWTLRDDAKLILTVANVEMRRALIERMGVREWIERAELKPTHTDRFGTFYRLGDVRHVGDTYGYVHVVCPSTRQDYFVPVPGNCRTAHEAVAWTFSMVPEDYDPAREA